MRRGRASADGPSGSSATTSRLLAWIAAGAVGGGAIAWLVATIGNLSVATQALLGLGVSLGGGVSVVGHLLTTEDVESDPETVTVPTDDETESADSPLPTGDDLFETHPDPVLYFAEMGDTPAVRAVNPAFEAAFGISTETAGDAPLSDALMTADRRQELAERAVREPIDRTVTCETVDGQRSVRLRSVLLDGQWTHGYVLFTPAGDVRSRERTESDAEPNPDQSSV